MSSARSSTAGRRPTAVGDVRLLRLVAGRVAAGYDRLPLFWGALVVNALLVLAAAGLIALTPFTVSWPIRPRESVVLVVGAVVMVVLDAVLLRAGLRPLLELASSMEQLDLLAERPRLPDAGPAEVRSLTRAFDAMFTRLEQERRSSSGRILNALESERRRVGQELHDEIGQRLTGTLLELPGAIAAAPAELQPTLVQVQDGIRATLDEVGRLAWQLRPGVLDDLGLAAALEALADTARSAGLSVDVTLPTERLQLPVEAELTIYRVAQEATTNTLRHANAQHLSLQLAREPTRIVLLVVDDGDGLAAGASPGPGITGMRERAHLLGGTVTLAQAAARGGLAVRLELPLQEAH